MTRREFVIKNYGENVVDEDVFGESRAVLVIIRSLFTLISPLLQGLHMLLVS